MENLDKKKLSVNYLSNAEARDIMISNKIHECILDLICKRDKSSKIVIIPIYYGVDCKARLDRKNGGLDIKIKGGEKDKNIEWLFKLKYKEMYDTYFKLLYESVQNVYIENFSTVEINFQLYIEPKEDKDKCIDIQTNNIKKILEKFINKEYDNEFIESHINDIKVLITDIKIKNDKTYKDIKLPLIDTKLRELLKNEKSIISFESIVLLEILDCIRTYEYNKIDIIESPYILNNIYIENVHMLMIKEYGKSNELIYDDILYIPYGYKQCTIQYIKWEKDEYSDKYLPVLVFYDGENKLNSLNTLIKYGLQPHQKILKIKRSEYEYLYEICDVSLIQNYNSLKYLARFGEDELRRVLNIPRNLRISKNCDYVYENKE